MGIVGCSGTTTHLSRLRVELLLEVRDLLPHPARHRARQLQAVAQVPRRAHLRGGWGEDASSSSSSSSSSICCRLRRQLFFVVLTITITRAALLPRPVRLLSVSVSTPVIPSSRGPRSLELLLPGPVALLV